MAAVIRVKRSNVSGNPATLRAGELAYSGLPDNGSNGGDRLYIGMGTETAGNAANHFVIGGKFFTDRLDHTAGTLTASKALVVDSNKKLDELLVDNLSLNGNTLSTTDTNGNLTLTPNGTGKVSIAGAYTLPRVDGSNGYILTTDGSGNVTWQTSGVPTLSVTTATAGISSLSYNNGIFTFTPPDLSSYATQSYVTTQGYITSSALSGYATESYVTGQGYITSSALSGYATESYVTGQGYITSSALSGYATESYVTGQGYITTATLSVTPLTASTVSSLTYFNGEFKFTPPDLSSYATQSYVQTVAQGLHIHKPVNAATTASLASITGDSVTYNNGTSGVGATLTLGVALTVLDGYTLQNGDRILVKNQANQAHNGAYTWATGGTVLTRSLYEDEVSQFGGGDFFFVTHGTINGDTGWVQTEALATFGSSNIIFQQFAGAGTYQAGAGLSQSGNIFSISTTYAGQSSITTLGTITAGTWNADTISAAKGGTGITTYNAYDLLVGTIAGGLTKLSMGTAGQFLQVNDAGNGLVYADIDGGTY
jgi:hypothetical protein